MYSFPHENLRLTHEMIAETPVVQGSQAPGAVKLEVMNSLPWKFELSMSSVKRVVYRDTVQMFDDVHDTPVVSMNESCSPEELEARGKAAKKVVLKNIIDRAWQAQMCGPLEEKNFQGERIFEPPTHVIDVSARGSTVSVCNFGEEIWDEAQAERLGRIFDTIVNGGEARQLDGCATIWVLPGDGMRMGNVVTDDEARPLVITENLFAYKVDGLASELAPYVATRAVSEERDVLVSARLMRYDKPWGLPKPDLITLL